MGIFFKSPLICLMTSPGTYKIQVILIRRKLLSFKTTYRNVNPCLSKALGRPVHVAQPG